jgi:hypothetical protein
MGAARVLHFGDDECHRLTVLRQAGYDAGICRSGPQLIEHVQQAVHDAILFPDLPDEDLQLNDLRSRTSIPFVLFGSPLDPAQSVPFDLIISPITSPVAWLQHLALTIERARRLRETSALILSQSQALRSDSESLRRHAEAVRQTTEAVRQTTDAVRQELERTRKKCPPPGQ